MTHMTHMTRSTHSQKFRCLVLLIAPILCMISCDRKPYVEYKVKLDKKSDACVGLQTSFHLNSNFGGERYEFEKCLPAGYDKSLVVAGRRGDTVVVNFTKAEPGSTRYAITLDIDSYPAYRFVTIDEDTYTITPSEK